MAEPIRHHFLPVFYLKSWCSDDGRLVEFSIPFKNKVKPRRVHPKGTGYIDRLYAIEGLPGNISHEVEEKFLSPVDSRASTVLRALIEGRDVRPQDRQAWSRFIMTLLMRMPTEIFLLKEFVRKIDFEVARHLYDMFSRHMPAELHGELQNAFEEYKLSALSISVTHILKVMSSEEIVDKISQMEWSVIDLKSAPHELLTSDRPVVVVRNAETAGSTIISLPIGPRSLFVAATSRRIIQELQNTSPKKVAEAMNSEVIAGANQLAYGRSDRQLTFIQNRFGRNKNPSFVTDILKAANVNAEQAADLFSIFDDDDIRNKIEKVLADHRAHINP